MFQPKRFILSLGVAAVLSACSSSIATINPAVPSPTPTIDTPVITPSPSPQPAARPWEEIAKQLKSSTVMVRAELPPNAVMNDAALSSGTGIVFSRDGYIVTNAHVVQGASSVSIALAGDTHTRSVRVVGISTCDDLAVLKVDNTDGLTAATFGKSTNLTSGEEVVALGYPLGGDPGIDLSVTRGIISRLGMDLAPYQNLIQTDAAINHGNSGGPLVNHAGEVVGINTLGRIDATNMNYAINIDQAQSVINDLKRGTNPQWLGVNLVQNKYAKYFGGIESGLVVAATDSGSPAARVEVQPADLLVKLEGSLISSQADVCKILRSHGDGDQLKVEVVRMQDKQAQLWEGEIALGDPKKSTTLGPIHLVQPPTPTPSPTPTHDGIDTVNYTFDANDGAWYTGSSKSQQSFIKDGFYTIVLQAPNSAFVSEAQKMHTAADMGVFADVFIHDNARAGVATRYSTDGDTKSFYACWIDGQNKYGCIVSVKGQWKTLAEPTASDAIKPGDVNRIGLITVDDTITLKINGTDVATFTDTSLSTGIAALYLENFDAIAGASFDNVAIMTPKAR